MALAIFDMAHAMSYCTLHGGSKGQSVLRMFSIKDKCVVWKIKYIYEVNCGTFVPKDVNCILALH